MPSATSEQLNGDVITVDVSGWAGLASDSTRLSGYETAAVDFSALATYPERAVVWGKTKTGGSPTNAKVIELFAVASMDGSDWPDVFDGTASAETITSSGMKDLICRPVARIDTTNTANAPYEFGPVDLYSVFGGFIPPKVVFFLAHDTGAALNATTTNHELFVRPINTVTTW